MIVEIALCGGAVALAVLVGSLVPLLIQLRKPVAESEYLLVRINAELPLLIKEMRATTENLNARVVHARGGVEHAAVLLHAAGALGDTVQRVHETVQGTSQSFLVNLASIVAGFRATTGVIKAYIHREGGTVNGR
jgi:small basic protein